MAETFTKLFGSITDSTIWCEDSDTRVVWVTLLAMADREGNVWSSLPGLAARSRVSLEKTAAAVDKFMAPDQYSRSKVKDGRRLEEIDRGWRLINYSEFRERTGTGSGSNPTSLEKPGRVYFLRAGDSIKIGFSQNPWARLASLKTGSPIVPKLMGHLPGTMADEKEIQKRFAHLKINLEWYRAAPELLDYIATTTSSYGSQGSSGSSTTEDDQRLQQEAEADREAEAEIPPPAHDLTGTGPDTEPALPALTGPWLTGLFGRVRSDVVGGIPWQGTAAGAEGAATKAAAIAATPGASRHVEASMRRFWGAVKDGTHEKAADIARKPGYAFGCWFAGWHGDLEEFTGVRPIVAQPVARGSPTKPSRLQANNDAAIAASLGEEP